jgi:uncharacterized coiled-coil protein SlyX
MFLEGCSQEYLRLVRVLHEAEAKAAAQAPTLEKLNSKITAKLAEIAELDAKLALAKRALEELRDDRSQVEAECELLSPEDISALNEKIDTLRIYHEKFQKVLDNLKW